MNVGFIGGGKMAEAILAGLIRRGLAVAGSIRVCEIVESRRAYLAATHGVGVDAEPEAVVRAGDYIFLAVKPQDFDTVLARLRPLLTPKHVVISIAAGRRLAAIERALPGIPVARVMPNLAAQVGESVNAYCLGAAVTPAQAVRVRDVLGAFGEPVELADAQFDAVTALSGSGPAFFAYFLHCMAAGGEKLGLSADVAARLARQTLLGTALVLKSGSPAPDALIAAVSSPKGTTVAGMEVLRGSDVASVIDATLAAAARRSEELSR